MMYKIKSFFIKVKRLLWWIPRIWNNHDFDYGYLIDLMRYKMSRMEKDMIKDQFHDNKKHIRYIRIAQRLIEISGSEWYWNKYLEPVEQKYGGRKCEPVPTEDGKFLKMKFYWGNKMTEEEKDVANKEYGEAMHKAYRMQKKAWNLLFKILAKQMRGWWT